MKLSYLGTATTLIEIDGMRLLTDPAFDPQGTEYDFGPWYTPRSWFHSEKTYTTPLGPENLGQLQGVLLSHDHHADNLDYAGRRLLKQTSTGTVITTAQGATRLAKTEVLDTNNRSQPGSGLGLADRVVGLRWGETTRLGSLSITATPARHGPIGTPRIHEVCGFYLVPDNEDEPRVWISGDTVMFGALRRAFSTMRGKVDVAILHFGGVRFPKLPVLGNNLFTFESRALKEVADLLAVPTLVPIHRSGWTHFREKEENLRQISGLKSRMHWLELGDTIELRRSMS